MSLRRAVGFTVIELLVTIAIIAFLMVALFMGLSKIRQRTQAGQAKNLIEKVHSALETYNLKFRTYPPTATPSGLTGSKALYYWVATAFRKAPDLSKGEVAASINAGPFMSFDQRDLRLNGAEQEIVDPWGKALHFSIESVKDAAGFDIESPKVYSFGVNQADDLGTGDDIVIGK